MKIPQFILLATAATGSLLLASPAVSAASPLMKERTTLVKYSDLDLSTAAGQEQFKKRVNRAVRRVCSMPHANTSFERNDQLACETRAKTAAMQKASQTIARHGGNVKVALD